MDKLKMDVAKQLKKLIEKYSLSQTEFAERTNIPKDTVSKLVNGKYSLSITNAIRISEAFNVSLDFLFDRIEEENADQYALNILLKHFKNYKAKSYWNNSVIEAHITISSALANLLDTLTNLNEAKIDDDLRKEQENRAKKAFLNIIKNESIDSGKYVLLAANYFTPEMKDLVEKLKEMQG